MRIFLGVVLDLWGFYEFSQLVSDVNSSLDAFGL